MTGSGTITTEGITNPVATTTISTDTDIVYKNDDENSVNINTNVSLGTNGKAKYTAQQLHGNIGNANPMSNTCSIDVPMSSVDYIGDYRCYES